MYRRDSGEKAAKRIFREEQRMDDRSKYCQNAAQIRKNDLPIDAEYAAVFEKKAE